MKYYGGVQGANMKHWLNFGDDVGLLRWVNEQKYHNSCSMTFYGAGNDPEAFGVALHHYGRTFYDE